VHARRGVGFMVVVIRERRKTGVNPSIEVRKLGTRNQSDRV
jgi:hypothetical protein